MKKNKKIQTKSQPGEMRRRSIFHRGNNIFLTIIFQFIIVLVFAAEPPGPGGIPGAEDPPLGGGAPIGEGLFFLLGLAVAYAGKKIYDFKKKKLME